MTMLNQERELHVRGIVHYQVAIAIVLGTIQVSTIVSMRVCVDLHYVWYVGIDSYRNADQTGSGLIQCSPMNAPAVPMVKCVVSVGFMYTTGWVVGVCDGTLL
jgi:hypothetical protein